jgi:hypothetical protein
VIVFVEAQHAAPFPAAQPKERCNHELHERHEISETLFVWFVLFVVKNDFSETIELTEKRFEQKKLTTKHTKGTKLRKPLSWGSGFSWLKKISSE